MGLGRGTRETLQAPRPGFPPLRVGDTIVTKELQTPGPWTLPFKDKGQNSLLLAADKMGQSRVLRAGSSSTTSLNSLSVRLTALGLMCSLGIIRQEGGSIQVAGGRASLCTPREG